MRAHLVLALFTIFIGCGNMCSAVEKSSDLNIKYAEASGLFVFSLPAAWKLSDVVGTKYKEASGPARNGITPKATVTDEQLDGALTDCATRTDSDLKLNSQNYTKVSTADLKTKLGTNILKLVTTHNQGPDGALVREAFYFLGDGQARYRISFTSSAVDADKVDTIYDACVASFVFASQASK